MPPRFHLASLAGLLAALQSLFMLRSSIAFSPDSWAYWQGSINLLSGHGYTYMNGRAITDWPPLFSLYLALWQANTGVSGASLIGANVLLAAVGAFGWSLVASRLSDSPLVTIGASLFSASFLARSAAWLLADNLKLAILPFLLLALVAACSSTEVRSFRRSIAGASVAAALLLQAQNNSLALVGAAVVLVLFGSRLDWLERLNGAAQIGGSLVPWLVVRWQFGQLHSHSMGIGMGHYSPLAYVGQLLVGISDLLTLPGLPGGALWLVVLVGLIWGMRGPGRLLGTFGFVWLVAIYTLFNVSDIYDPLMGRHLMPSALVLVPVALAGLAQLQVRPQLVGALVLFVALVPLGQNISTPPVAAQPGQISTGTIQTDYIDAAWSIGEETAGRLLVVPPPYPWLLPLAQ